GRLLSPAQGEEYRLHLLYCTPLLCAGHSPRRSAQCHQGLAYFRSLVETPPAAYQVGNVAVGQCLLNGRRLRVDAEEHGHVAVVHAGLGLLGEPIADPGSLNGLILRLDEFHFGPRGPLRLQRDRLEAAASRLTHRSRHDRVRASNNLGGRAGVAYQPDHCGIWKTLTEPGEVARLGSSEGMDGLCRITNHTQLSPATTPQVQPPLLQWAHVLVLIDDQVPISPPDGVGDLRML